MIEDLILEIIQKPLFLRLKKVVENNPYHDHETVYDHLIKTKDIAQREIRADFITNPEAKQLFLEFINEEVTGMKRADLMILVALLHDAGKILSVKEGGKVRPIVVTDAQGQTSIPGHEYWGSTIVDQFLEELSLDPETVKYISTVVGLHDAFQGPYLPSKEDWKVSDIVEDMKSKAEGFYIESMFNNYCDVFTAEPFQPSKKTVIKIFNEPDLYIKRDYVIT